MTKDHQKQPQLSLKFHVALPAAEIEAAVLAQVDKALQEPEMIIGVWQAGMALRERQEMDEPTVLVAMRQMSQVWEHLFPIEQNRIVRLLIERVQLHEDGLDIIWCDDSWLYWQKIIDTGEVANASELARRFKLEPGWVSEVLRMTRLAPDIIRALLEGRQPRHVENRIFSTHV